jgi:hypothetical protein
VRERSLSWLILSAVLHGVGWLALVRHEARSPTAPRVQTPVEFDVVTLRERAPEQGVAATPAGALREPRSDSQVGAEQSARAVAATSHAPDRTRAASPRHGVSPPRAEGATPASPALAAPLDGTPPVPDVETLPQVGTGAGDAKPAPAWTTLDPRAAALSLVDPQEQAPAPSAAEKLNEAIARGALRPNDRPPDPVLRQGAHGGYVFAGNGFTATISPRGDVDMSDRYGTVHIPLVPYQTPTGEWRIGILGGSFRLFEWLDRKFGKNDPYRSERRWFLDRTRTLRERLAREFAPGRVLPPADEVR